MDATYTDSEVLAALRARIAKSSYRKLSREMGYSVGLLCMVRNGDRPISERLAAKLGFEPVLDKPQPRRWKRTTGE